MGADRRPVCQRCAQIKQACDGSLPCSRCTRLSLPCRPRDASGRAPNGLPIIGSEPLLFPDDDAQLPKARIRRVQTGCLMCKKRKKKCDEVKPNCGDCRRLCLDCIWPVERPRAAATKVMMPPCTPVTKVATNGFPISPADDDMMQITAMATDVVIKEEFVPDFSPSSSSGTSSVNGSVNGQTELNGNLPFARSGEMEMFPIEGMSWDGVSADGAWYGGSPTLGGDISPAESATSLTLTTYIPHIIPQLSSPVDRALFNHYTTVVSGILSRRPSMSNPYNHYLLPMAHSNDLVLHCILALSGNHWRKMQPDLANRGLVHKSKAQQALAQLLPHVNETSADIALVSSLLLCMTELFDGSSQGWEVHLNGAKRLLSALRRQHGQSWTGHYKFLLRLSRFLDSAATTSTCRPPLMESEADEARALEGLAASPEEDDSAVYGIPKELFHLVDQVNTLAEKRKYRVDAVSEARFREEAALVEDMIDTWSHERHDMPLVKAGAHSPSGSTTSARSSNDVHHATTAYEYALRLRLHQVIEGYNIHDPLVQQAVATILDAVQSIRYGSALEACLLFPLVMAGGACQTMEQRVVVQDKLMVMERTCGFGYVYNARQLVERVWRRRDEAGGTTTQVGAVVNWAKIRYEEMHGLVVF
ncbi:hypothetical protein CC79DRAFT_548503 [Sarocladium strictum]